MIFLSYINICIGLKLNVHYLCIFLGYFAMVLQTIDTTHILGPSRKSILLTYNKNEIHASKKYPGPCHCYIVFKILIINIIFKFQSTVKSVESNINHMLQHQYHVRSQENRDYNLLIDNKTYVNRWSIMQIFLIMGTTTLQVYFVRKLFETKAGKSKTRA